MNTKLKARLWAICNRYKSKFLNLQYAFRMQNKAPSDAMSRNLIAHENNQANAGTANAGTS